MNAEHILPLLFQLVNTDNMLRIRQVIENNAILLTPLADLVLAEMLNLSGTRKDFLEKVNNLRQLLAHCREHGIEPTFAKYGQPAETKDTSLELLNRLQSIKSVDDLRQIIVENPGLLPILHHVIQTKAPQFLPILQHVIQDVLAETILSEHLARAQVQLELLRADSTDEAIRIIGIHPFILTEDAQKTIMDLAKTLPSLEVDARSNSARLTAEEIVSSAKQKIDLIQRVRELRDKSGGNTVEFALQHLVTQVTLATSCKQIEQLLEKYGDILLTDLIDTFMSDVISNIKRITDDEDEVLFLQNHQIILRYLKYKQTGHPILSLINQYANNNISATIVISKLKNEFVSQQNRIFQFIKTFSLYIPTFFRENPETENSIWHLCMQIADLLEDFKKVSEVVMTLTAQQLSSVDGNADKIPYLEKILGWAKSINNLRIQLIIMETLAGAYKKEDQILLSLQTYESGIAIATKFGYLDTEEILVGDMGHIYSESLSQPKKAAEYHYRALEICRHLSNESATAMRLNSLALDYRQLGEFDKSVVYSHEAISIVRKLGKQERVGNYLLILGDTYHYAGNIEKAAACYTEAAKVFKASKIKKGEQEALANLSRLSKHSVFQHLYLFAIQIENGNMTLEEALVKVQKQEQPGQITEEVSLAVYEYTNSVSSYDELSLTYILATLNYTIAKSNGFSLKTQVKCTVALANICAHMGNYKLSKTFLESVLENTHLIDIPFFEANFSLNYGNTLSHVGNIETAILYLDKARNLFAKVDQENEVNCLNRLGFCSMVLSDMDRAIVYFEQGLAISPNRKLRGLLLGNFSQALFFSRRFEEAERVCTEAIELFQLENMDNDLYVSKARLNLIRSIKDMPEQKQIDMLEFAIVHMKSERASAKDPHYKIRRQLLEAIEFINKGSWDNAEILLQENISVGKTIGYDALYADSLGLLVQLRLLQDKPREALVLFENYLEVRKNLLPDIHESSEELNCNIMAIIYKQLGDWNKSIEYCEKGLEHATKNQNKEAELALLGNLEEGYRNLGKLERNLTLLEHGLKIAQELKNEQEEIAFLGQTAMYYGLVENWIKSDEYFQKAIAKSRQIGERKQEGNWLDNLGISCVKQNRIEDARQYFQEALNISREMRFDDLTWHSLRSLGFLESKQGNFSSALQHLCESIDILEEFRLRLPIGQYRRAFLDNREKWSIYQAAINCLVGLDQRDLAFDYSEKLRARNLAEQLQAIDSLPRNVPANLLEQFQKLYSEPAAEIVPVELNFKLPSVSEDTIESILGQQIFLASTYRSIIPTSNRPDQVLLKKIYAKRNAILEEIKQYDPEFAYASQGSTPNAKIISELLSQQKGHVVVEINVGDTSSQLFVIAGESIYIDPSRNQYTDVLTIPKFNLAVLNSMLQNWLIAQLTYSKQPSPETREYWFKVIEKTSNILYDSLILPILDRLANYKAHHITFVPPMGLSVLPLHAASYMNNTAIRYLLDDYEISYTPSCAVLHRSYQKLNQFNNRNQQKRLLAFSNPTQDLVFSEHETSGVSQLFPESIIYLRDKCEINSFIKEAPNYEYLHFAGHANYDMLEPMNSALQFFGGIENDKILSRRLTLKDIFQALRLPNSRLVTLSACQTGVSNMTDLASEFVSLSSGFMHAGAPAIVSSLWSVNDLSTGLLMKRFYNYLINNNLTPSTALRQAELWLKGVTAGELTDHFEGERQKSNEQRSMSYVDASIAWRRFARMEPATCPFAHPYYWAAFTLNGA